MIQLKGWFKGFLTKIGVLEDVKISEFCKARGNVKVTVTDLEGFEYIQEDHNLLVTLSRQALAHLVCEADSDFGLTTFQAGTGGHVSGDPLTPVPPSVGDTTLEEPFFSKALSTFEYLPVGVESSVKYTIVMERAEGNDTNPVEYTEVGLFCANGNLFARHTFVSIPKVDTRVITFEWEIFF